MIKKGFTLAEVLITLAIIGVVAALTIPTLMADSRYQLLSSRIAKFRSTTEDAALAYAAMNEKIDINALDSIIMYKRKYDNKTYDVSQKGTKAYSNSSGTTLYDLKDDTIILVKKATNAEKISDSYKNTNDSSEFTEKYGDELIRIIFIPRVNGLGTVHAKYRFIMTDKGYVMPLAGDDCLNALLGKDYNGKMDKTLATSTACSKTLNSNEADDIKTTGS